MSNRIFASLICLATLALPTTAQADDETVFDNGVLHFDVADGVLIENTRVGTVDVIIARTSNAFSGTVSSRSFVSITIFRDNECTAETCRARVLARLQSGLAEAQVRPSALPDDPSEPLSLRIAHDGAVAECELRAHDAGAGTVVVTYAQFDTDETIPQLATLLASIELGPAPEVDESTQEH